MPSIRFRPIFSRFSIPAAGKPETGLQTGTLVNLI
jgi:hypothetical protein